LPLPPAPRLTDWRGNWSQTNKRSMKSLAIVIHGNMLAIKGDASVQHGAKDNYNFGEFDDEGRPSGLLSSPTRTVPAGPASNCWAAILW